jgi:hypothetical protein
LILKDFCGVWLKPENWLCSFQYLLILNEITPLGLALGASDSKGLIGFGETSLLSKSLILIDISEALGLDA